MRFLFLVLAFLLMFFCSFGQNKYKVDSLSQLLKTSTHDTAKVSSLLGLFLENYSSNPDTAIIFCEKALHIAEKANLKEEMAECYGNLAYMEDQRGDISKALEYNIRSAKIFKQLCSEKKSNKVFKNGLATVYNNIGLIYDNQGEIDKALEYFFMGLKIYEAIKDKKGIARCYNNIGVTYSNQHETEKALEYYFLGLKIYEEINDKKGIALSYNNIGYNYDIQGEIEKSYEYYRLRLKIEQELKSKKGMANAYHHIGFLMCKLDSMDKGMRYIEQGLTMFQELGHKEWIALCQSSLGGWHLKLASSAKASVAKRQVEAALKSGLEALRVAKEIGHVENIMKAAWLLNQVYKKQNKFKDALTMYELQIEMKDSIINEDNTKATIRQQMKYDYEKEQIIKEQQENEAVRILAEAESRRNSLHYSAIFIGMFLLFGVVLMLGFVRVPPKGAEAIIFLSFLILFEFLLVLLDPFVEEYTGGAPIFKLILNAVLAGLIFPLHQFFDSRLRKKLIKGKKEKISKEVKALMFIGLVFIHPLLFAQTDTPSVLQTSPPKGGEREGVSKIDSLKSAYEVAEHDTTRINILFAMGGELILSNPDTVLLIVKKAMEICNKNLDGKSFLQSEKKFKRGLAEAYNNIGVIYDNQGKTKKALEYYFLCLKIQEKIQVEHPNDIENKTGMAYCYNNIGYLYNNQGQIEKALEYYFLSLKLKEEMKDKKGVANSYNNIGVIYNDQGEIEEALKYFFLCLKLREAIEMEHPDDIVNNKGIADSYNNIGFIYEKQEKIKKALKHYFLSLRLRKEFKDKKGMAESYHNIGNTLCELDSLEKGMRYLQLGLGLVKELGFKARISDDYSAIARWQLNSGQVQDALESGLKAMVMAKEIGNVEYIKRAANLLSDVYRKLGNAHPKSPPRGGLVAGAYWEKALEYYELEIEMRDSIVNEENTKATIRQQMKYEHEKEQIIAEQARQDQLRIINEQLSRRDNLHYSAIFIGILILFGGVLMLGFVRVRPNDVEGIIFISFLILFEFVLVLADPHIEQYTGGAPGYKLLFNAGIAGLMFPLHQFFERKLKKRIIKVQRKKLKKRMEQYRKDVEEL